MSSRSRRVLRWAILAVLSAVSSRASVVDVGDVAVPSPMGAAGTIVLEEAPMERTLASAWGISSLTELRAAPAAVHGDGAAYVVVGLDERRREQHNRELAAEVLKTARNLDAQARLLSLPPALREEPLTERRRTCAVLAVSPEHRDEIVDALNPLIPIAPMESLLSRVKSEPPPAGDDALRASAALFDGARDGARDLEDESRDLGRLIAALEAHASVPRYAETALARVPAAIYGKLDPFMDALQAIAADEGVRQRRRDDPRTAGLRDVALRGYLALQAAPDPAGAAALRVALWRRPGSPIRAALARSNELAGQAFMNWTRGLGQAVDAAALALGPGGDVVWQERAFARTELAGQRSGRFAQAPPHASLEWAPDGALGREAVQIWSLLGFPGGLDAEDWPETFAGVLSRTKAALGYSSSMHAIDGFTPILDAVEGLRPPAETMPRDFSAERFVSRALDVFHACFNEYLPPSLDRLLIERTLDFVSCRFLRETVSPHEQQALARIMDLARTRAADHRLRIR